MLLWPLEDKILTNKGSIDVNFSRQLAQNQAKTSLLLSHRLGFEPSTLWMAKNVWYLVPRLIWGLFYVPCLELWNCQNDVLAIFCVKSLWKSMTFESLWANIWPSRDHTKFSPKPLCKVLYKLFQLKCWRLKTKSVGQ